MLNALIIVVFSLLVILIAKKFGFLEVLAIVLALVALIPFGMSVFLYFFNRPVITYQLANKSLVKEGNKFVYEGWLVIQAKKGKVLLDGVYISYRDLGLRLVIPGAVGVDRLQMFEESEFRSAIRLDSAIKPFFTNTGYGYILRFESELEKPGFVLDLFVDTKVDPAKLGYFSIFQTGHIYRFAGTINANFKVLDRQEGELKSVY